MLACLIIPVLFELDVVEQICASNGIDEKHKNCNK
jgi:hypothetical protein